MNLSGYSAGGMRSGKWFIYFTPKQMDGSSEKSLSVGMTVTLSPLSLMFLSARRLLVSVSGKFDSLHWIDRALWSLVAVTLMWMSRMGKDFVRAP